MRMSGEHLGKCTVYYLKRRAGKWKKVTLKGDVVLWDHWVNIDVKGESYWIPKDYVESIKEVKK